MPVSKKKKKSICPNLTTADCEYLLAFHFFKD